MQKSSADWLPFLPPSPPSSQLKMLMRFLWMQVHGSTELSLPPTLNSTEYCPVLSVIYVFGQFLATYLPFCGSFWRNIKALEKMPLKLSLWVPFKRRWCCSKQKESWGSHISAICCPEASLMQLIIKMFSWKSETGRKRTRLSGGLCFSQALDSRQRKHS